MSGYKIFKGYRKMLIGWKIKEGDCYLSVLIPDHLVPMVTKSTRYCFIGTKVTDHTWYRPIKPKVVK